MPFATRQSAGKLPAAVEAMIEKEETSYQYCGVSYLVHREVKMLKVYM